MLLRKALRLEVETLSLFIVNPSFLVDWLRYSKTPNIANIEFQRFTDREWNVKNLFSRRPMGCGFLIVNVSLHEIVHRFMEALYDALAQLLSKSTGANANRCQNEDRG